MKTVLRLLNVLVATLLALLAPLAAAQEAGNIVVIGHPTLGRVDARTLQRLYTGRAIEVAGTVVTVVNLPTGNPLRARFIEEVLDQDDDKYVAYWTVRRHIGKGAPPRELKTPAEVIEFVQSTPGGIGYISAADLRPGLNVVFKP